MVNNRWAKRKGINAERDLINLFWSQTGWCAHRIAGSGSSRYPSPDLIVGNNIRKLAIEVKITSANKKYFTLDEIDGLKDFSRIFGAEPWVAIKFSKSDNKNWFFFTLEDLNETDNSFNISLKDAEMKGLLFEELIK
ncbi:Holliday junction resolvase [Candidatus Woesearchaeota archaeon]|nr:Holliday junction resolvase [Candidatus Woesearchaeota archaeon]